MLFVGVCVFLCCGPLPISDMRHERCVYAVVVNEILKNRSGAIRGLLKSGCTIYLKYNRLNATVGAYIYSVFYDTLQGFRGLQQPFVVSSDFSVFHWPRL